MSINLDYANDLDMRRPLTDYAFTSMVVSIIYQKVTLESTVCLRAIDAGICIAVMKAVYKVIWRYVRTELCH